MDMTRRDWLGLVPALGLGAIAARPAPAPAIDLQSRGSRDPGPLLTALATYAQAELDAFGLPGMALAVAGPDGLRATIALGLADIDRARPVRPDHLFQIGSISKSFVALCLFRLAELGKVDLDATAASVLPDIPWPDGAITIAMLLNHTAGLADIAPAFPRSPDGRLWTNYPPGSRFSYSNTAYGLLGMIVARVSGLAYHQALRRYVFEPLGMDHAVPLILARDRGRYPLGYAPLGDGPYFPGDALTPGPWVDNELAGGSVGATAGDMALYAAYLVRLGQGRGAPLMSDALARRFVRPTIAAPDMGPEGHYACGIATVNIDGRECLHHTGGMVTFFSSITIDPLAGGGVFASTNGAAGDYRPRGITFYGCRLLRAFAQGSALPAPPAITPVPAIALASTYVGRFLAANGDEIVLTAPGSTLQVTADKVSGRIRAEHRTLVTDHPRLARHPIEFVANHQFWWGGMLYGRDLAPPTPPSPPAIAVLAGHYVVDNPWWGQGFSLVARGDTLVIEGLGPLVHAADGSWRSAGGALPAERLWFEAMCDGKPQRLVFSGNDLRRFPTDED